MRIPYGYVKNNEGIIRVDKEQAEVVRLIFCSYRSGLSLGKISDLLEQEGITALATGIREADLTTSSAR